MGFKLVILSAVRKEEVVGIRSKFPTKVPVRSLFLFLLLFHQHPEFTYMHNCFLNNIQINNRMLLKPFHHFIKKKGFKHKSLKNDI